MERATIEVRPDRVLGRVDPLIYGQFLSRRRSAHFEGPTPFAYSTQSSASCSDPPPVVRFTCGSAPIDRQKATNAAVPNPFPTSYPKCQSRVRGRSFEGPVPSCQW
jgi:hypothetical protein